MGVVPSSGKNDFLSVYDKYKPQNLEYMAKPNYSTSKMKTTRIGSKP